MNVYPLSNDNANNDLPKYFYQWHWTSDTWPFCLGICTALWSPSIFLCPKGSTFLTGQVLIFKEIKWQLKLTQKCQFSFFFFPRQCMFVSKCTAINHFQMPLEFTMNNQRFNLLSKFVSWKRRRTTTGNTWRF